MRISRAGPPALTLIGTPSAFCKQHSRTMLKFKRMMAARKARKQAAPKKYLFPWVSDQWGSLEDEQKRERRRQDALLPHVCSPTRSVLKGICTLYGVQPGTYCQICNVIHEKTQIQVDDEADRDTSGFQPRGTAKLRMERRRAKKRAAAERRDTQMQRMAQAADALKHRRRKREKKMKQPRDGFLVDHTDNGGSHIDKDMRKAIRDSMKNQGLRPRDFRGRLKTKRLLVFPPVPSVLQVETEDEEKRRQNGTSRFPSVVSKSCRSSPNRYAAASYLDAYRI